MGRVAFRCAQPTRRALFLRTLPTRTGMASFEREAFRARLERGRKVAREYRFEALARSITGEEFRVTGGSAPYTVRLDLSGKGQHLCSCPDLTEEPSRGRILAGGFCKHIVGAALSRGHAHLLLPGLAV